jgi:cytochrome b561
MRSNGSARYGAISQAFHWFTVVLIIALLWTGWGTDVEADQPGNSAFLWHSSLGVLVLILAFARLLWRFFTTAPPLPVAMRRSQRIFARAVHVGLYLFLFALPISGWLVASAEGGTVNFFGVALPSWQGASGVAPPAVRPHFTESAEKEGVTVPTAGEKRGEFWEEAHEALAYVILGLAILHTLAALKHHFVDRDNVLRSMLPGRKHL